MCGIAGIYDTRAKRGSLEPEIRAMTEALSHRGPDDFGYHVADTVALGHRRLSIIDLKGGHQPIYNEDSTACIVYNGEVYNYREIKKELEGAGHRFTTNSDTETILHAYEQWGEECVGRLHGMFAFCVWDSKKKTLFMARDRFGKKPFFYAEYNGRFVFSSEMKSILLDPGFKRTVDDEALAAYFMFTYVPAPLTIYRGIKKLLPGHTLTYRDGQTTENKYWDIRFAPDRGKKEKDFIPEFMELLREAVRMRLLSEVPLGAFLSGGVDSSTVVALMSGVSPSPVNTFTIGFSGNTGGFDDERKYARLVAERYATNHKEYEVAPSLEGIMEKIAGSFDEPFADDSTIPSYYVYEMAGRDVRVALSGLGGDEAFCGYERYLGFHISRLYGRLPGALRDGVLRPLIERIPESGSGGNTVNHLKRFVRSSSKDNGERYLGFVAKVKGGYRDGFFTGPAGVLSDAAGSARDIFLN
ncbi:MAG TPA: asparagine synthase (glutamine-hydrolyzing), partial [Thermodesulfobacteriota bacterium]|nr:asparagine synthase (glutamine-hydrolyzing) [Thermodesulfobacteriota bacterium]